MTRAFPSRILSRLTLALALLSPLPVLADAVSDAIAAAASAYDSGDMNNTAAQLITATKELVALQSGLLAAKFPPAPDGWTRSDNTSVTEGLAMMGGGAGAEASYSGPDGANVTLSAYADNMMVQSMASMLGNPATMALMGKTAVIGGVTFLDQDGDYSTLVNNRVLLQTQGGNGEMALKLLEQMDLSALGTFDAK